MKIGNIGDYWGTLHVVSMREEPIYHTNQWGERHQNPAYSRQIYTIQCDCGKQFELAEEQFPGRRRMRTCPDCVKRANQVADSALATISSIRGAGSSKGPSVTTAVYIPIWMFNKIEQLAEGNRGSRNAAIVEILSKGLGVIEAEDRARISKQARQGGEARGEGEDLANSIG